MINWALLSTLLRKDILVSTDWEHSLGIATAILGVEPYGNIPEIPNISIELQGLHKFIFTLDRKQRMTEDEKVQSLKKYLGLTITTDQSQKISQHLYHAGYNEPINVEFPRLKVPNARMTNFEARKYHDEIVKHCQKLFESQHYTNAVFEVSKAYNAAVKSESKLSKDGYDLMMAAFSENGPLKVNAYSTDSEKNEQNGVMHLSAGLVKAFRNPTAHETALSWRISEDDCLDILSFISFLFNKLDWG